MPADGAGEDAALEVAAHALQVVDGVAMRDARHVLLDDGAGVELGRDVVGRGSDDLHAALPGLPVRVGADEGGKERVVDVDDPAREPRHQVGRHDLHVAGEDDQVGLPVQQGEHLALGLGPALPGVRDVVEGDPEALHGGAEVGVVRDHRRNLGG